MENPASAIAALMGLDDLRPGRHVLRNDKRWRVGELLVVRAWHAKIIPAFHDLAAVAVVHAHDTEFRGQTFKGFLKAGIAIVSLETNTLKHAVIADISEDPLPQAVKEVDLMSVNDTLTLDGIGYELNISTNACRTKLCFSNPRLTTFKQIERALMSVGEQLTASTRDKIVRDFLQSWRGYVADR